MQGDVKHEPACAYFGSGIFRSTNIANGAGSAKLATNCHTVDMFSQIGSKSLL